MTSIMETNATIDIRKNGVYYTPPNLADFLVKPLINRTNLSVLDPACGEGALLFAAKRRFDEVARHSKPPIFFGCDRILINGRCEELGDFQFFNSDFLKFSSSKKFDLIVMNPPYVRHHLINNEEQQEYRKEINKICRLKKSADLWTYFLVKSVNHLKTGGSLGAILPWSFLQSDYACDVRQWLLKKFEKIQVLALSNEYFEKAEERIILVWLRGYGQQTNSIKISFSDHIEKNIKYYELKEAQWKAPKVVFSQKNDIEGILQRYIDEFGFSMFKEYAIVNIGIVTGADKFFILSNDVAIRHGFKKDNLIPIINTSRELAGLSLNGREPTKMLIKFPKFCSDKFKKYIKGGEHKNYHLRAHSLRRNPWYAVLPGTIPDAFFPYRASNTPYLVFNNSKMQCTNSIHRINFKKLSENAKKWLQISLLSSVGQLSLEAYSKTYGNGVLKIEPSSLKNAIVQKGHKKIRDKIYDDIARAISNKDRNLAVKLSTNFINESLNIPKELSAQTISALEELQSRRLSRGIRDIHL